MIKTKKINEVEGLDLNLELLASEMDSESIDNLICYRKADFEDSEQLEQFDTLWSFIKDNPYVVAISDYAFMYEVPISYSNVVITTYENGSQRLIIFDKEDRNKVRSKLTNKK